MASFTMALDVAEVVFPFAGSGFNALKDQLLGVSQGLFTQ